MDAPLRVDQSPSTGSLPLHRRFLPRGADMSRGFMRVPLARSHPSEF
jgi:hypothetical protein